MRHITLAFRMLRKTPFVTAIAVLSLALGIGANAAIFSLFDQMLLRSLPVPEPQQLVNLGSPGPKPGSQSCNQAGDCDVVFSYPMFRDLERQQQSFTGIAAHLIFGASLAIRNEPSTGEGMYVSGSYFPTLQVQPALGRLLGPDDDRDIGQHFVAVLGHQMWQQRFGGDPGVLNQTLIVNGHSMTIVGVAPRDFRGTTLGVDPQVYVPITMRGVLSNSTINFENRRQYYLYLFGRLKPGVTIEQARTAINTVYTPILTEVEAPLQTGMSDATMANFRKKQVTLEPGYRGQSSIHREAGPPLYMLLATTTIVLLIACANIANLLLARGATRATEMGVRLALGAGRGQLLMQLLTESIMLAVLGGVASLVVAKWTLHGIAALLPPDASSTIRFELQPIVLVFAGALAVATGLVFGLFPALHSTRTDLISSIRAGASQISGGGRSASRFRTTLVTAQIALAMTLLTSSAFFIFSLQKVASIDMGLDVDQVVTFSLSPTRTGYDSTRALALYERVEEELRAIPGVTGVTSSRVPLLSGSNWGTDARVQGFECGPDTDCNTRYNEVGGSYMTQLGMRLIDGREINENDRQGTTRVAVVNEAFAEKFKMGRDVVGKFMSVNGTDSLTIQIVGLVQNAKYSEVKQEIPPVTYIPWRQNTRIPALFFYVSTSQSTASVVRAIPDVMRRIDPMLPVEELKTMPQQIRENTFMDRMISTLSASFAFLATLLASVGLYGVLAYSVSQRTREIGVRMALGANAARVRWLVMRQMGFMMAIGAVIGIFGAYGIGRLAQSLLFEMQPHNPLVFVSSLVLLTAIAMLASYVPARRAAKVDPMQALRYD